MHIYNLGSDLLCIMKNNMSVPTMYNVMSGTAQ